MKAKCIDSSGKGRDLILNKVYDIQICPENQNHCDVYDNSTLIVSSVSVFRFEEVKETKLKFPFKIKCIDTKLISGHITPGKIYEAIGPSILNADAWCVITNDGKTHSVLKDCFEILTETVSSQTPVQSIPETNEEWRLFQHKAEGDCPCGIKRIDCSFHK
jgi:hypothetical protein